MVTGRSRFYCAKISKVHPNGTYDLNYDDGERELCVSAALMRLPDAEVHRMAVLEAVYMEQHEIGVASKGCLSLSVSL